LAYQLLLSIPRLQPHIQKVLAEDPAIIHRIIPIQLQRLIIQPFTALAADQAASLHPTTLKYLVIIDGLDECFGTENQCQILDHINFLVGTSIPLCFLIISRPEYNIHEWFNEPGVLQHTAESISLYGQFNPREDVHRYLIDECNRICKSSRHRPWMHQAPKSWPSESDLNMVVKLCDGYFIYASTLVKFLDTEYISPIRQLAIILDQYSSTSTNLLETTSGAHPAWISPSPFAALDELYSQILSTYPNSGRLKLSWGPFLLKFPACLSQSFLALSQVKCLLSYGD
jgi:hypothetical protein